MAKIDSSPGAGPSKVTAAEVVVRRVRQLIDQGELRSGDRLPPERALALQVGVSRLSVRSGLKTLAAMGVVQIRQGSGTFITGGPPALDSQPLSFLAALHGFTRTQMFEARLVLEVAIAGLAAERAAAEKVTAISDEITGMFASLDAPDRFLEHDIRFHQAVAATCDNPILVSIVEMISTLFREFRRTSIARARDLKQAAEEHRLIYRAIRARDPDSARHAMDEHLRRSLRTQALEEAGEAAADHPELPGVIAEQV